jgi:hypothetical protein
MLGGLDFLSIQAAVKRAISRVGVVVASLTTTGNLTVGGASSVTGNSTVGGNLSVTGTTALTGTPTGPTAAADTNTTQLATTAFVLGQAASQAEQETGSSTTKLVTSGRQQYHPSAAKVWAEWNNAGTIAASYNVSSITDNGPGDWTVNFSTAFSSASYSPHFTPVGGFSTGAGVSLAMCHGVQSKLAGSARCNNAIYTGSTNTCNLSDSSAHVFVAYGDQ